MLKFLTVFIALLSGTAVAQQPPVEFTAEQDHQHMMDLLGIKALRRGPSGNDSAPNHANYDEALANPYPDLPDVLTLKNGTKVTTRDQWWTRRRPEIVEDLEREVYGRLPPDLPRGDVDRDSQRAGLRRTPARDREAARRPRGQLVVSRSHR